MLFTLQILIMLKSLTISDTDTIYDFSLQELNSVETIDLSDFKGKKILIVNVASRCGFTKQYRGLQELYEKYDDQLVVIGLPCNQFLGQEPGSEEKIEKFCTEKFGVSFPMTEKIKVRGKNQHPLYEWLTKKDLNGVGNFKVKWNFHKFLIDENGNLLAHFPARVKPMDEEILSYLD